MPNQNDPTKVAIKKHLQEVDNIVRTFVNDFYKCYDEELNLGTENINFDKTLEKAKNKTDEKINKLSKKLNIAGKNLRKDLEKASKKQDQSVIADLENQIKNLPS